jgi:hypothetical protein
LGVVVLLVDGGSLVERVAGVGCVLGGIVYLAAGLLLYVDVGTGEVVVRDLRGRHRFRPGDVVQRREDRLIVGRFRWIELSTRQGLRVVVPLMVFSPSKATALEADVRAALRASEG